MSLSLLITQLTDPLALDKSGTIPDSWVWLDRYSNGLISRLLWSQKTKKPSQTSSSKVASLVSKEAMGSWMLLHPFNPQSPLLIAVWNSDNEIDWKSFDIDHSKITDYFYDAEVLSENAVKQFQSDYPTLKAWPHNKELFIQVSSLFETSKATP